MGPSNSLSDLLSELVGLLSGHPPLTTRNGRDAWLTNLPDGVRSLITRRDEHCETDLALILNAIKNQQMEDGRWPILILVDRSLQEMQGIKREQDLMTSRQRIEECLAKAKSMPEPARPLGEGGKQPIPGSPDPTRQEWLRLHKFKWDPFWYTDGGSDPYLLNYFYRLPDFYDWSRGKR
jgi:hypothetical protein